MTLNTRCQLCGNIDYNWTIKQIEFNVGLLRYYKIMACESCTDRLSARIIEVMYSITKENLK